MLMIFVGISGAIDHGKSTLAEYMTATTPSALHYESSDIIMEVANLLRASGTAPSAEDPVDICSWLQALPEILQNTAHTSVSFEDLLISPARLLSNSDQFTTLISYLRLMELMPERAKTPINRTNKNDYRMLLQWLGGYLAKTVSGQLWFEEIVTRATSSPVELVVAGGLRFPDDAVCLRQAGAVILSIERPAITVQDPDELTERERSQIIADSVIVNDGSLEALRLVAIQVYDDLKTDSLKPQYIASSVEPTPRIGLSFH